MVEVMPVDRTDVVKAQFLEQSPAGDHPAGEFFGLFSGVVDAPRQLLRDPFGQAAQPEILARTHHSRQIGRQPADRRRDRHVVVVQDDDQAVAGLLGVVHRLIRHARRHRAVADHRDGAARRAGQLVGDREAQRRADRGRGMRRAERVVLALAALGEAAEPPALPQGADPVAPPGQDLVRIALVPDVPDQPVVGRVEHIMDRGGQLDHAEPRAQMPAGHADRADRFGAQFVGQLPQLFGLQLAEVGGGIDRVEQRSIGAFGHDPRLLRSRTAVTLAAIVKIGQPKR